MIEEMDREPYVENRCCVVKPIGTTRKMASKKEVETKKICLYGCLLNDARFYLV
jgi:hypothetical protein